MMHSWKKIGFIVIGLLTSLGVYSTNSAASHPFELKAKKVDASTPLYLMHANNIHPDSLGIMSAEHESHYSHSSHDSHSSHNSHSSHYSHYSSRW